MLRSHSPPPPSTSIITNNHQQPIRMNSSAVRFICTAVPSSLPSSVRPSIHPDIYHSAFPTNAPSIPSRFQLEFLSFHSCKFHEPASRRPIALRNGRMKPKRSDVRPNDPYDVGSEDGGFGIEPRRGMAGMTNGKMGRRSIVGSIVSTKQIAPCPKTFPLVSRLLSTVDRLSTASRFQMDRVISIRLSHRRVNQGAYF